MDSCVENNDAIIINRENETSVVLLPISKYKNMDETEFLMQEATHATRVLETYKKMKAKAPQILDPETYAKKYGK